MLGLKNSTNPEWVKVAKENVDLILIDHAHCEKKAAGTGFSLLSHYPDKVEIQFFMTELITEEIEHYRRVMEIISARGKVLTRDKGDEYARELISHISKNEPERLLDRLITAALIEARSCERLKLLGENLEDPHLREFYTELAHSEAEHFVTFIKLAKNFFDEETVKIRTEFFADIEAGIVSRLSNLPLIHG